MIALAIIGVLSAVAVLGMRAFLDRGASGAVEADQELLQQAADAFRSDRHKGPTSNVWGQVSPAQRLYPTKNGLVGGFELGTATDPMFTDRSNLQVHVYEAGSSFGIVATNANITGGAVWIGLLVNEPAAVVAEENDKPGLAHPLAGEKGQYLLEFPESASETNTDTDTIADNLNGKTSGSYTWIILHNGRVVPAYLGEDNTLYSGSDNRYP